MASASFFSLCLCEPWRIFLATTPQAFIRRSQQMITLTMTQQTMVRLTWRHNERPRSPVLPEAPASQSPAQAALRTIPRANLTNEKRSGMLQSSIYRLTSACGPPDCPNYQSIRVRLTCVETQTAYTGKHYKPLLSFGRKPSHGLLNISSMQASEWKIWSGNAPGEKTQRFELGSRIEI